MHVRARVLLAGQSPMPKNYPPPPTKKKKTCFNYFSFNGKCCFHWHCRKHIAWCTMVWLKKLIFVFLPLIPIFCVSMLKSTRMERNKRKHISIWIYSLFSLVLINHCLERLNKGIGDENRIIFFFKLFYHYLKIASKYLYKINYIFRNKLLYVMFLSFIFSCYVLY